MGPDPGLSEDGFWLCFLRGLVAGGLSGLALVVSDAHEGLKKAIATARDGAGWQRRRLHLPPNILAQVPNANPPLVATLVHTLFVQPDAASADELSPRSPPPSRSASRVPRPSTATPGRTSWPTPPSRLSTGGRSGRPSPWSA
jgi:putative transposase